MPSQQAVQKTQEYWQGRLGREVHPCEAYRAARNMTRLTNLLLEWDQQHDGAEDTVGEQADLAPSCPI